MRLIRHIRLWLIARRIARVAFLLERNELRQEMLLAKFERLDDLYFTIYHKLCDS